MRGIFVNNVLASFSIAGLMPSNLVDGDLLFDGGSFNNFPVDHIRKLGARHLVGIDLLPAIVKKHTIEKIPNSKKILWDKFSSKKKQKYRKLPSLPGTFITASVITPMARQKQIRDHVDILFHPNTRGIGLLDWHKYDMIFQRVKQDANAQSETIEESIF